MALIIIFFLINFIFNFPRNRQRRRKNVMSNQREILRSTPGWLGAVRGDASKLQLGCNALPSRTLWHRWHLREASLSMPGSMDGQRKLKCLHVHEANRWRCEHLRVLRRIDGWFWQTNHHQRGWRKLLQNVGSAKLRHGDESNRWVNCPSVGCGGNLIRMVYRTVPAIELDWWDEFEAATEGPFNKRGSYLWNWLRRRPQRHRLQCRDQHQETEKWVDMRWMFE